MLETTKEIVVAMIEHNYLPNYENTEKTIDAVNDTIDKIYKQLLKTSKEGH